MSSGGAEEQPASSGVPIEPRWPLALVLGLYIVTSVSLRVALPDRESVGPHWLVPAIEVALLLALLAADPTHLARRSRWLRPVAITLISLLTVVILLADGELITNLIRGSELTESAAPLLASGALVWIGTAIVFGLLYWELDSGGPLARHEGRRPLPDLAFSQHMNPELAPAGWRPQYVDYLVLGICTSMAFSPTDVMPMARWVKLTMALQSLISLTVIGLVIARAVNVLK